MAKSIWKQGASMTRLEKKQLRTQMPHPNRGRGLYKWRVENARLAPAVFAHLDKEATATSDLLV